MRFIRLVAFALTTALFATSAARAQSTPPSAAEADAALKPLLGTWIIDAQESFRRFSPDAEMQTHAMVQAQVAQGDRLPLTIYPGHKLSMQRGVIQSFTVLAVHPDGVTINLSGGRTAGIYNINFVDKDLVQIGMKDQPFFNIHRRFFDSGALIRGTWTTSGSAKHTLKVNADGTYELADTTGSTTHGAAVILAVDGVQPRQRIADLTPEGADKAIGVFQNKDGSITVEGIDANLNRAELPDSIHADWTIGEWQYDPEVYVGTMIPEHIRQETQKRVDADPSLKTLTITKDRWGTQFEGYSLEQYSPGLFALIGNGQMQAVVDVQSKDRMILRVYHTLVLPMKRVEDK